MQCDKKILESKYISYVRPKNVFIRMEQDNRINKNY